MKADFEKVKRVYEKLKEIEKDCGYREFEVAYLILERLDNVIDDEADITKEVVEKVNEIADNVDTLLDEYVNEELDNLEREFSEKEN